MNIDVAICLPQEAETVSLIRGVLSDALRTFGVDGECVDDISLALSEACTNVLDHAADEDEYEVRLEVDDHQCVISVKNNAGDFDSSNLGNTLPDDSSPRGRGVAIMRAVMDHVELTSEPSIGTIVRLVKTLSLVDGGALDRLKNP